MGTQVLVAGALGRMGLEVVRAVIDAADMSVSGVVDPATDAGSAKALGVEDQAVVVRKVEEGLSSTESQVMVDFTTPDSVVGNIDLALNHGVHAVVGATGISEYDRSNIPGICRNTGKNCLIAPNFSIGAVLMMRLSEVASPHFDQVEIVERHHDKKADAPSGTAIETAERVVAAGGSVSRSKSAETFAGARGADIGGVTVHSVRLAGLSAHQEVVFGGAGQTLTIKHDVLDRSCYMPGVLLAIRRVGELPGLTIGIDGLLDPAGTAGAGRHGGEAS
ncbi:MAG: 4-hydroxy-tetrahydrodipicolinate reductase [Terriglobia bacterium]